MRVGVVMVSIMTVMVRMVIMMMVVAVVAVGMALHVCFLTGTGTFVFT